MFYFAIKVLLTAVLVVAIGEVGKRSLLPGGLLASTPLTSLLALAWLQVETGDTKRVAVSGVGYWIYLQILGALGIRI